VAPVVSAVVRGVAEAAFVTLVVPLEAGAPLPSLTVRRNAKSTAVEVRGLGAPEERHVVAWRVDPRGLALEEATFEAGGGS
jgi:hypothetical protein